MLVASGNSAGEPFSGFFLREWYFSQATRGLRELSGNSSGISGDSGDSGEMGEAGAPRTLPSTRAWGQDDGSSHKLPQTSRLSADFVAWDWIMVFVHAY